MPVFPPSGSAGWAPPPLWLMLMYLVLPGFIFWPLIHWLDDQVEKRK